MSEGVIIAIIGLAGLIIGGWFAFKSLKATLKNNLDLAMVQIKDKQEETHKLVNSRMTELLELTKKSSKAEGMKEEKDNPTGSGSVIPNAENLTIETVKVEQLVAKELVTGEDATKKEEEPGESSDEQLSQTK